MKKVLVTLLAVVVVALTAGGAFAATANVQVTARIVGTCRFNNAPTLAFGDLDQTLLTDATATVGLEFWCTANAVYSLTDEDGLPGGGAFSGILLNATLDPINYSIAYNNFAGNGGGKTAPITSTLSGTILNADYVNAPTGSYTDTVTFTITP